MNYLIGHFRMSTEVLLFTKQILVKNKRHYSVYVLCIFTTLYQLNNEIVYMK